MWPSLPITHVRTFLFITAVCVYYCSTYVCVFITAVPITKLFAWLRETSRGLCRLVCPSRTSERRGKGDCVKEGGGEEGGRERERALGVRLRHGPQLRLTINAAALAAASPTLLLSDW